MSLEYETFSEPLHTTWPEHLRTALKKRFVEMVSGPREVFDSKYASTCQRKTELMSIYLSTFHYLSDHFIY